MSEQTADRSFLVRGPVEVTRPVAGLLGIFAASYLRDVGPKRGGGLSWLVSET